MGDNEAPAVYGVLGYPAAHSLSPCMHQAAFNHLGINAEYRIFEVRPEAFGSFLQGLSQRNIHGLNVTIPYKEQILPLLNYISPDSSQIGAVNTVKVKSARLEGFNTDGQGFMNDCTERGCYPKAMRIAVIGAGGASRSVCNALAKMAPAEIAIYNRDGHRAQRLIDHLREQFPRIPFRQAESVEKLGIPAAGLLVNASSVGMKADDPVLVDPGLLHKDLFVYDLVYRPSQTPLVRMAREKGARGAVNGSGMLLQQAMLSFEIWTGIKPPRNVMERALEEEINGK